MTLTPHVKHLIIAGVVAVVLLVGVWKVLAYEGNVAHDQRVLAEEKLKNDLQIAQVQAQKSLADGQALQQQLQQLRASNSALEARLRALDSQLSLQREKDQALDPSGLAARWGAIVGVGQITSGPAGLTADLPAAHATVDRLEAEPVVEAELAEVKANSQQKDSVLKSTQVLLSDKQAELLTCKQTQTDAEVVCSAKLKEQVAKQRKRGVVLAVVTFIGGVVLGRKF